MQYFLLLYLVLFYLFVGLFVCGGCRGCDRMVVVQSVSITTKVVSSNPVNDGMYSIQLYVINFISDLRRSVEYC